MSDPMANIKPIAGEQRNGFRRPAHRLINTGELVHRYYHSIPSQQDLFAEQDAINAWPTVTACYSGIEQAIKFLLKIEGNLNAGRDGDEHHRIGTLFQKLAEEQRQVIRKSYRIYQSLHDYIGPKTADDFLGEIDKGYSRWRYFLLEGRKPPTTHYGAMLEVWSALANIIQARVFTNHGLYHCARRFDKYLKDCVHEAWQQHADPETGATKETAADLNRWQKSSSCLLNSWTKILRCHAASANELDVLPLTKDILLASIGRAKKRAQSDQDFAYFLERAERSGIIWNNLTKRFETP